MKIGNREFDTKKHTYVMGILNVTPDSFSDGGKWLDRDICLRHVEEMIRDGADLIDVGGESTRPGYVQITCEEEIQRTAPIIEKIKSEFDIPLSLDTYKTAVACAGIEAGADMINDIWGLKYENEMGRLIAQEGVSCCLMHNRKEAGYTSLIKDIMCDLEESLAIAKESGIPASRIVLDPGVGFAKSYEDNLEVLRNLRDFKRLGFPVLLGCSRKSVIGLTLDLPADERLEGTLVTTAQAVFCGCSFVRVHDVKENVRAVRMAEQIKDARTDKGGQRRENSRDGKA